MCSVLILLAKSCYTDNFQIIGTVFGKSIVLGVILGTVVGVLVLFVNHLKK